MSIDKTKSMIEEDEEIKGAQIAAGNKSIESIKVEEVGKVENKEKENLNLRAAIVHMIGDMV